MREKYTTREKEPLNEWASDRKLKYRRPPYRYMYNTHTHTHYMRHNKEPYHIAYIHHSK